MPMLTRNPDPSTPAPAPIAESHNGAVETSPSQVRDWLLASEAVLFDVREPDEHAREHIRGATLAPLSTFDAGRILASVRAGHKAVFHCRGGRRSADACRLAASIADGRVQIFTMTGGIEAWKSQGLPVELDSSLSRISVMRQVQLVIGIAVLAGSALAWLVDPLFLGIPAFFGAGLAFAGATGTCALAALIAKMPWNRAEPTKSCCKSGSCG